ncbi:glycoside hydrolase family 43 protein [Dysgonomonas sp. Marseille-P4677]|uniref:glycoside hydrolase family 43 protein n=1 Tax=Dysgonomonas sp. Marseille-P4677 TaxID=2364790 RepID=UPI001913E38B|nr:glycoside hydrolase family 43 protein [Dysgonomonas sp. Marseille-P4677]MBK5721690.1 glycoside hydrolase family 43 protein [Dysgonomonas sp. Marseille-P4677]
MASASSLSRILILISMVSYLCSCDSQVRNIPKGEYVAFFDYFTYTGEDDYYKNNPLPDNSSFYNPILPGWYSDPSICFDGKDYFLVTSTFIYYPGVPIFHSKDLVNWKQIGHVLDRSSQLENFQGQKVSGGIFAPAISYNPHNQTYYMITTNVGAGNFFVKTKDPFGKWSEPIYLPEVGGIDPSFFFDDNGRAYIINNDGMDGKELYDGHRSIRIREFDVKIDKTIGPWKMLVNGGVNLAEKPIWIEGPHMYKIKGKYYLMAAEGGTGPNHTEVIFRGDTPMGDFKPWEKNPILTQKHLSGDRTNPITCAGHADLIQTKEGDWWAVFLACRPIDNKFENLGRETFILPVRWSDDGYPYMTKDDEVISMILKREGVTRGSDVTFGNFDWRDDFELPTLGLDWITLRSSAEDLYSLSKNPGYLSLKESEVKVSEMKTPAFLARRMQHHKFVSTTRMYFNPSDDQDIAGILLFKDEDHHIFFAIQGIENEKEIKIEQISGTDRKVLAKGIVSIQKDQAIDLKVVSNGTNYDFYYNVDDNNWQLLALGVSAQNLSTANAGGFTGTTIGLYATKDKQ